MVKKKSIQEIVATDEPVAIERTDLADSGIHRKLSEIRNDREIIGYIIRNSTSAAIDLRDPTRISEYALLSLSAFEASQELASFLNLGEIKDIELETKNLKALSLVTDENRVSLFMEKDADSNQYRRKLSLT